MFPLGDRLRADEARVLEEARVVRRARQQHDRDGDRDRHEHGDDQRHREMIAMARQFSGDDAHGPQTPTASFGFQAS